MMVGRTSWRLSGVWNLLAFWTCWSILLSPFLVVARKGSSPELSSTILQTHKLYTTSPPHDTRLYDILHVSPNATAAQITKSYRNRSRRYHPDKVTTDHSMHLKQVQDAYDILKDDSTRLPYHQYGLTDPNVAVAILLGPHHQQNREWNHLLDRAHHGLLQLMGYEYFGNEGHASAAVHLDPRRRRQQRVRFVAARLVERLRPLVEETVSPHLVAHQLAQECDQWKRLPLGAQVIRCVGRAYRHAGQDFLQRQRQRRVGAFEYYSVPVRQQWRKAKAFWTAMLATGRATLTEKVWVQQEKRRQRLKEANKQKDKSSPPQVDYHSQQLGNFDFDAENDDTELSSEYPGYDEEAMFSSDDEGSEESDQEERTHVEQFRVKQTLLTSLQVEALWKVAKIDLDGVVRRACRMILKKEYFYFPSHQTLDAGYGLGSTPPPPPPHGWVTTRGTIMDTDKALEKTAEALVFLGNVMVERSKADTSWKD